MNNKALFKKMLRKTALYFAKNNRFLKCLIKEMIYESQKRSNDSSAVVLIKDLNKQLADEQARKLRPINRAMPVHLTLETTLNCNLRCIMCQNHRNEEERRRINAINSVMPLELFERVIEDASPELREVCLTVSGEPLMSPNLSKIIDILKNHSIKLELITNFTLMNDGLMEKMIKILSNLQVSFDGASKNTFEKIRRGSNFETVIKNIKRFNDARRQLKETESPKLFFDIVLMRSNIEELPGIIELAKELEVDNVNCSHVIIFERALEGESLFRHKALANEFILKARQKANQLGVLFNMPEPFQIGLINSKLKLTKREAVSAEPRFCDFLWKKSYIGFNGDVTPCCVQKRPVMGNIYQQSLEGIWNGEMYREMRRRLNSPEPFECCKYCYIYPQNPGNGDDAGNG